MDGNALLIILLLYCFSLFIFYAIIKAAVRNGTLEADYARDQKKSKREKVDIEKNNNLQDSIDIMVKRIISVLPDNEPTIYLYGSVVLNDFKLGWSDIDILCLTKETISEDKVKKLLMLRQTLLDEYPSNNYFRSFEGGFLTKEAFLNKTTDKVVYWGTSGQKITDKHYFDSFALMELKDSGKLLYGKDIRDRILYPIESVLVADVKRHYEAIRKYALTTNKNVHDCGWLFDIARGLYTLKTGKIIAKTSAGEWAINNNLVPDSNVMKMAVEIRKNPIKYKTDKATLDWVSTLGPHIQKFADVLEKELETK